MVPSSDVLTYSQTQILNVFKAGFGNIAPDAMSLLGIMAAIEVTIATLFWVVKGEDVFVGIIKKIMIVGFFVYMVQGWSTLIETTIKGFTYAGMKAGGGATVVSLADPSAIIKYAFDVTKPLDTAIDAYNKASYIGFTALSLELLLIKYLIIGAIFLIAIQVFICNLEFWLVAVLSLILIPFGVSKHTSFLAEKAIGTIIAFGIKLMVLAFILSASMPILQNFQLPASIVTDDALCLALIACALAFLAIQAPNIAAGMLAGGPSLTAKSALATAAGGVAGAVAGWGAMKAASNAPQAAKEAVSSVGKGASKLAATGYAATYVASAVGNHVAGSNIRPFDSNNSANLGSKKTDNIT